MANTGALPVSAERRLLPSDPDAVPDEATQVVESPVTEGSSAPSSSWPSGIDPEVLALLNAVNKASQTGLNRKPGLFLIGVGVTAFIALVSTQILRTFGMAVGELAALEYVSTLVGAAVVIVVGAMLHVSGDLLQANRGKAASQTFSAWTQSLHNPPADKGAGGAPRRR
jgi:hypothetical protein